MAGDVKFLEILPSFPRFGEVLKAGTTKAADDAGKASGLAWAKGFGSTADDGATKQRVADLEKAAKAAERAVNTETQSIAKARASQRDATAKVIEAESRLDAARAKGDTTKVAAAEERLEAARERQRAASTKVESAEGALRAAYDQQKTAVESLEAAQRDLTDEADGQVGVWDRLKGALSGAKSGSDDAERSLGGMVTQLAAAAGGAALFSAAWSDSMDLSTGTAKVTAALGLTESQSKTAGEVAGALYADSYGESMGDVTGAVEAVMSSMAGMRDASEADLQQVTGQAMSLASAFDLDVQEAVTAAGGLISNGLAPDATGAFDLITASLQQVPAAMRGDVLDAANEYGGVFASLGLDGAAAMGMLAAASDGGAIAIDKTGDALKEFTIRATDMSTASVEAYDALGLNAEEMSNALLAGGDSASGAMQQIVDGLLGIKDPATQANTAIALFGTPIEDLGVNEIPGFLEGLSQMGTGLGDVSGKAGELDEAMAGTVDPLEQMKRSFMGVLTDGLTPLLGPVQAFADWATNTPGVMTAVAVALGVVAVAWAAVTLAASPWLAIGVGVAAVIAGVILAVQNWGTITDWLAAKWGDFTSWLSEKTAALGQWWSDTWTGVRDNAMGAWQAVADGLKAGWDFIYQWVFKPYVDGANWLWQQFVAVKDGAIATWDLLKAGLKAGGDFIATYVFEPVKQGAQWVWDKIVAVKDGAVGAWNLLKDGFKAGWDFIDQSVFGPLKAGVDAVRAAFDTAVDLIGAAWDKIKGAAAAPVNFIIETVYRDGIKATFDKIASAVGLSLSLPTVNPIKLASGGVMPGWSPGRDIHQFFSPTGGRLDLSGGEAVMRPEFTRAVGGPDGVAALNRAAVAGRLPSHAFAGGGIIDWLGSAASSVGDFVSGVAGGIKNAVINVASFLADPVRGFSELLTKPMNALLSQVMAGDLGQALVEYPRKSVESLIDKALGLIRGMTAPGDEGGPLPSVGGWVRPMRGGRVTSRFGPRWGAFHNGIDLAGGGNTFASWAGRVKRVGWNVGYGNTGIGILLDHDNGYESYYGHNPSMSAVKVTPGQVVGAGQHIGREGATGNVTGVHLHYSIFKNGRAVNPESIGVFDQGGLMLPDQLGMNLTNTPEMVFNASQWQTLDQLAARGAAASTPAPQYSRFHPDDLEYLARMLGLASRRVAARGGG